MFVIYFSAVVLAVVFLLQCAVVGRAILRGALGSAGLRSPQGGVDGPMTLFFSLCLGMLANMAGLFVLGMAGYLQLVSMAALALAMLAVSLVTVRGTKAGWGGGPAGWHMAICWRSDAGQRGYGWLEAAMLVVLFLLTVAVALHPPGHWDDTMYQLPLARHYVEHQAIVLHEYLRFPLFPQNFNLLFALGLMLGDALQALLGQSVAAVAGLAPLALADAAPTAANIAGHWRFGAPEVFAQMFASLPLFVMVLGLWAATRRYMGSGTPGLLAGLTLFMVGPVKSTLGFAYIDNGLALYCWAATLAVAVARDRPALAGLLAGAACGSKYFGLVLAVVLGLVLIVFTVLQERHKNRPAPGANARPAPISSPYIAALRVALVYAGAVILAGCWWYVRSAVISGDPAHPAGARWFGFFLWNEADLASQHAEQAVHGVQRNPLMLPVALLQAGVLLWLPVFAGLFLRGLPPAIRTLQAVFLAYMLFWFFVTQVPRYLAPVYGVGSFLAFHALHQLWVWAGQRRWRKSFTVMPAMRAGDPLSTAPLGGVRPHGLVWPLALVFMLSTVYVADRSIKYGREFVHAEEVLATNAGYSLYQQANAHIGLYGPRLVQVGFEDGIYFFQGTVIGDWFGPGRYRDLLACPELPCGLPPPEQLENTLRSHGARMLLLSRSQVALPQDLALGKLQLLAQTDAGVLLGLE